MKRQTFCKNTCKKSVKSQTKHQQIIRGDISRTMIEENKSTKKLLSKLLTQGFQPK